MSNHEERNFWLLFAAALIVFALIGAAFGTAQNTNYWSDEVTGCVTHTTQNTHAFGIGNEPAKVTTFCEVSK